MGKATAAEKETVTLGTTVSEEQLLAEAAKIDSAADTQDRKNPLDQVIAGEAPDGTAAAAAEPPKADPAVQQSLLVLVNMGTLLMTVKQGWSDPGDDWRREVARLGAVLIDRYLPNFLSEQGEIVALVLMVGSYAATNVISAKAASGSNSDSGAKGKREEHFVVTDPPGARSSDRGHT